MTLLASTALEMTSDIMARPRFSIDVIKPYPVASCDGGNMNGTNGQMEAVAIELDTPTRTSATTLTPKPDVLVLSTQLRTYTMRRKWEIRRRMHAKKMEFNECPYLSATLPASGVPTVR